jgi:hypothetical protein
MRKRENERENEERERVAELIAMSYRPFALPGT